jgi:hypothetical protein
VATGGNDGLAKQVIEQVKLWDLRQGFGFNPKP